MASDSRPAHEEPLQVALRVIRVLEGLGVNAWIGGSLASSIYGFPRATQDADIIADLPLELAQPLVERLGEAFYADTERIASGIERRASFNVIHLPTMFKVDILLAGDDAWSARVIARRHEVEIDQQGTSGSPIYLQSHFKKRDLNRSDSDLADSARNSSAVRELDLHATTIPCRWPGRRSTDRALHPCRS